MNYNWSLKETIFTKNKGTVCNEIDKNLMDCYIINHNPKYPYCESIQEFKKRNDLPIVNNGYLNYKTDAGRVPGNK